MFILSDRFLDQFKLFQQFPLLIVAQNLVSHGEQQIIFLPDMVGVEVHQSLQASAQTPIRPRIPLHVSLCGLGQFRDKFPAVLMLMDANPQGATGHRHPFRLKKGEEVTLFLAMMTLVGEHPHELHYVSEDAALRPFFRVQILDLSSHDAYHRLDNVMFLFQDIGRIFLHVSHPPWVMVESHSGRHKHAFCDSAYWTDPLVGNLLERSAGWDTVRRVAHGGIIDILTDRTDPTLHIDAPSSPRSGLMQLADDSGFGQLQTGSGETPQVVGLGAPSNARYRAGINATALDIVLRCPVGVVAFRLVIVIEAKHFGNAVNAEPAAYAFSLVNPWCFDHVHPPGKSLGAE